MKKTWFKYWGTVIVLAVVFYIIFHQLPSSVLGKIILPGALINTLWIITNIALFISLLLGIVVKLVKTKKVKKEFWKKWKVTTSFLATIIIILSVLYLSFAVELPGVPSMISDSNDKINPLSNYDERCTFPGYYRVINENEKFLLSKEVETSPPNYRRGYGNVAYFSDKSKAIADGHEDNQLVLLDFSSCKISKLPLGFNLNFVTSEDSYFFQNLLSLSSDNKFIVYQIDHGFKNPPYPGSVHYSAVETAANGVWLYNLQSRKNYQLRRLEIDSDTNNISVNWATNTVSLFGADCPQGGCSFDLRKY